MTINITLANAVEWANAYDGPLFHALLCDPPYHLSSIVERFGKNGAAPAQHGTDGAFARASRGFMGREWDGGDVAFRPETWAAFGRIMHPGAFGMAFASTRGFHRMAVAIEDAGFIIHPVIMCWAFGCLSDDTEILTRNGWEPYHKAVVGTDVLCYNTDGDALEWHAVQELYTYEYDDTAYNIRSDHTDQIVSRNHRCLVERSGKYVFQYAETLQSEESVPVLESVSDMWQPVQRGKQRRIPQNSDMLKAMPQRSGKSSKQRQKGQATQPTRPASVFGTQGPIHNMCMWQGGVEAECMAKESQAFVLLSQLPSQNGYSSASNETCSEWQGQEATRQGACRCAESGMEGRDNVLQNTWQLRRSEVHSLSCGVHQHGTQGWLCDGTQDIGCSGDWTGVDAPGSSASQGSQSNEQRSSEPATIRNQSGSQTIRTSRVARSDLADVNPIHYKGVVWCVRVPTGAFVARRNGKIFITGNSGFPKATRLDVQIDRAAGVDPLVVGSKKHQPKFAAKDFGYREKDNGFNSRERERFDLTSGATPLAQAWGGHRYGGQALKPALEPVIVFQKPYQGRPIDCITRTGAGAINIDAGRIATEDDNSRARVPNNGTVNFNRGLDLVGGNGHELGRWPANLILSHHPECNGRCVELCPVRRLGEQSGESSSSDAIRHNGEFKSVAKGFDYAHDTSGYDDSGTAARYFYNADWMAERLEDSDPLAYFPKASTAVREAGLEGFESITVDDGREKSIDNAYQRGETTRRNIHPTIKPLALARHLATLLLPPAEYGPRRLFVPFAGVASEMIGAMLAGWEDIQGVELEADHIPVALPRPTTIS